MENKNFNIYFFGGENKGLTSNVAECTCSAFVHVDTRELY